MIYRSIRPGTGCLLERHILPVLGSLRLAEVRPLHIEDFLKAKAAAGPSARTVRNMLVILQGILSLAHENELIPASPIRRKHKPAIVRQQKPVWTAEQIRIIAAVPESSRVLFTTIALTDLRLGELLALQWKDVDFELRKLKIDQSPGRVRLFQRKRSPVHA